MAHTIRRGNPFVVSLSLIMNYGLDVTMWRNSIVFEYQDTHSTRSREFLDCTKWMFFCVVLTLFAAASSACVNSVRYVNSLCASERTKTETSFGWSRRSIVWFARMHAQTLQFCFPHAALYGSWLESGARVRLVASSCGCHISILRLWNTFRSTRGQKSLRQTNLNIWSAKNLNERQAGMTLSFWNMRITLGTIFRLKFKTNGMPFLWFRTINIRVFSPHFHGTLRIENETDTREEANDSEWNLQVLWMKFVVLFPFVSENDTFIYSSQPKTYSILNRRATVSRWEQTQTLALLDTRTNEVIWIFIGKSII